MDFLTRINAVLHGEPPDQVPFAPYDNLMPRGDLCRDLRNRSTTIRITSARLVEAQTRRDERRLELVGDSPA